MASFIRWCGVLLLHGAAWLGVTMKTINNAQWILTASVALLAGCGNSSAPAGSDPVVIDPPPVFGALVPASIRSSDMRDADTDGFDGIDPILSPAPTSEGGTDDTLIRASVFIPEHREGETFPVILHSHGWGGSRETALATAPSGGLFNQITQTASLLRDRGYVVVSFDERGWGESEGNIRVMDPEFETVDAIAVLDWVQRNAEAGNFPVAVENGDMVVGTLGVSYGGGFQFPLAALDDRVDVMVPVGTWHDLQYSLTPNDRFKGSFANLLCLLSTAQSRAMFLTAACTGAVLPSTRSAADIDALDATIIPELAQHGTNVYAQAQAAGSFQQRPVDVLLIQGTRDVLFNFEEALRNYDFYEAAGGDVRLLTDQGGHMNPLAGQTETAAGVPCGTVDVIGAVNDWFDAKLKGLSVDLSGIPEVCISLDEQAAVRMDGVQVGGARSSAFSASVSPLTGGQVFVPLQTIAGDRQVIAGSPVFTDVTVTRPAGSLITPFALMGIAVQRSGEVILIDEQVSPIAEGTFSNLRVPGVGERLQDGDVVGLLLFDQQVQYSLVSAEAVPGGISGTLGDLGGLTELVGTVIEVLPPTDPNFYDIAGTVELPIFTPDPADLLIRQ